MSTSQATQVGVMLPTEHERKQIFFWLKQISSYTAWNRIFGLYQAWAQATEECARQATEPGGPAADYGLILNGLAHCEEAVLRLKKGDKRIFKFDANGELAMADRLPTYWEKMLFRMEDGETLQRDEGNTPGWTQFHQALVKLCAAWGECAPDILESQWLNEPAHTIYGDWFRENLPKMHFPSALPDVPTPRDEVLIPTGKTIPYSGIWEPVDAPKPPLFSLFRNNEKPTGPFPIIGCMNYLHGGSPAPIAKQETADDSLRVSVTWRLLWRDTRYEDGTVPAEEAGYVFLKPDPAEEETLSVASDAFDPLIWAESGQPAPQTGRWLAEHDLQASITLQAGEILPMHQGRKSRWTLARA
ncbi:Imm71 family immunity protein [Ralstonia mojiangensis]|uniref:Imm71 family immunity protein n=1 Tax=Ralstonia mojiangensis TaxID=2953895 RepID=UPI0021B473CC|nr:Imm71 family immunity protein [Ralstonia mojiangensis]MCT7329534.1 Imm71 family immunity protein [Ralstonia mojiangensis]